MVLNIYNFVLLLAKRLHKFCSFNRNEPCGIAASCELIAAFAGELPETIARVTTENAHRIYGLKWAPVLIVACNLSTNPPSMN